MRLFRETAPREADPAKIGPLPASPTLHLMGRAIIFSPGLGGHMASITIRNLEDPLKVKLRIQAAYHGRSMEEEARHILRTALTEERQPSSDLGRTIRQRFASTGGIDLDAIERRNRREVSGARS
jgi:plasmid stability protein